MKNALDLIKSRIEQIESDIRRNNSAIRHNENQIKELDAENEKSQSIIVELTDAIESIHGGGVS